MKDRRKIAIPGDDAIAERQRVGKVAAARRRDALDEQRLRHRRVCCEKVISDRVSLIESLEFPQQRRAILPVDDVERVFFRQAIEDFERLGLPREMDERNAGVELRKRQFRIALAGGFEQGERLEIALRRGQERGKVRQYRSRSRFERACLAQIVLRLASFAGHGIGDAQQVHCAGLLRLPRNEFREKSNGFRRLPRVHQRFGPVKFGTNSHCSPRPSSPPQRAHNMPRPRRRLRHRLMPRADVPSRSEDCNRRISRGPPQWGRPAHGGRVSPS